MKVASVFNFSLIFSSETWRFAIDYGKLNAVTQYPQFLIPVINDILANITSKNFMPTLDLTSGIF